MRYFTFFLYSVFKIWSAFYAYSTSGLRLATFQGLSRHRWLVATMLDRASLTDLLVKVGRYEALICGWALLVLHAGDSIPILLV